MLVDVKAEAPHPLLCALRAHQLEHADRHHVLGLGQRATHRHRALELSVIVLGFPGLATGLLGAVEKRRVVHHGHRRQAFFKRSRVDEGLEAGARLAPGLGHVVELVLLEIEATDQRVHRAGVGIHSHEGRLDLGQLADAPPVRRSFDHPNQGPRAELDRRIGLFR
ncbi:hypothetical protein FQZ97_950200 [compost metagenome]